MAFQEKDQNPLFFFGLPHGSHVNPLFGIVVVDFIDLYFSMFFYTL